jgi:hypothetical protein
MPSGAVGPCLVGLAAERLPDCSLITPIGLADIRRFISKGSRPKRSDIDVAALLSPGGAPRFPLSAPLRTRCAALSVGRADRSGDC